jgi:hypothetical protein
MFTKSKERFDKIAKEAPQDMRHNLIQVTKFQAGQNCKVLLSSLPSPLQTIMLLLLMAMILVSMGWYSGYPCVTHV